MSSGACVMVPDRRRVWDDFANSIFSSLISRKTTFFTTFLDLSDSEDVFIFRVVFAFTRSFVSRIWER